jgi:hypothetical protein
MNVIYVVDTPTFTVWRGVGDQSTECRRAARAGVSIVEGDEGKRTNLPCVYTCTQANDQDPEQVLNGSFRVKNDLLPVSQEQHSRRRCCF